MKKRMIDDISRSFGTGDCPYCGQPVIDLDPYPNWYRVESRDKYLLRQAHYWAKKEMMKEAELLKQQKEKEL